MGKFDRNPRGQSSTEYALVLVLVAVIVILALLVLGGGIGRSYQKIVDALGAPPQPSIQLTAEVTPEITSTEEAMQSATPEVITTEPVQNPDDGGSGDDGPSASPTAVPTDVPEDSEDSGGSGGSGNSGISRFYDEFDGSGNIQWLNRTGTWATTHEYFTSSDDYSEVTGTIPFDNYDFRADVQTTQSKGSSNWDVTMVLFRVQSANTYYAVMLKKDGVVELASNRSGQWQGWLSVTSTRLRPYEDHTFRVKAFGNHFQVFIDNKKYVDYRDGNPISSGGIGFSNNNSVARIDNVEVDKRQG